MIIDGIELLEGSVLTTVNGPLELGARLETIASIADAAGFNIPHGTAPDSPSNGDVWSTDSGLFIHIDGTSRSVAFHSGDQTFSDSIVIGNPGTEGAGIVINGSEVNSILKVTDLGWDNVTQFIMHRHSTNNGPWIVGARSHSNDETHVVVQDGDDLLVVMGAGWDGDDSYQMAGAIRIVVAGTPGDGDMPGAITFSTTPDGQNSIAERMRIGPNGLISTSNSAGFTINGTGETLATFVDDGAVTLYYDNTARIATTNEGIQVTGNSDLNGSIDADGTTHDINGSTSVTLTGTANATLVLNTSGLALTGQTVVTHSGANPLQVSRSGTATNCSIQYTTTGGSMYAGIASAGVWAIDSDNNINASPIASFSTSEIDLTSTTIDINGDVDISGKTVFGDLTRRSIAINQTSTGTTQGDAHSITTEITHYSTVANGSGAVLPASVGTCFIVMNTGANTLNVYPPSGASIDSLGTNNPFELLSGGRIMFICTSSTRFRTLNATYL